MTHTDVVTELSSEAATPSRRGSQRRKAILDAVFDLLAEVGYDRMTMDAVATRAKASKATIYRTWTDKPALVVEAMTHRFGGSPKTPNTGSLRGDLYAMMSITCALATSDDGEVIAGLITAAAKNPELAQHMHACTYQSKRAGFAAMIGLAVERGEIAPDTDPDLLHEVLYAMVLARKLGSAQPLDEAFAKHVVDDVLMPILTNRQ
jgi:AcrR family transcriptional regulator